MKKMLFIIGFIFCLILLSSCDNDKKSAKLRRTTYVINSSIQNASFETGDVTGWDGDFESYIAVEDPTKIHNSDGRYFVKSSKMNVGNLISTTFTLNDTGYISFLIGAGNGECMVEIYSNNQLIKSIKNPYFSNHKDEVLRRVLVNLKDYIGQEIYIKIVDNEKESEFGYICIDSFDVNVNETDLAIYKKISIEV